MCIRDRFSEDSVPSGGDEWWRTEANGSCCERSPDPTWTVALRVDRGMGNDVKNRIYGTMKDEGN